MTNAQKFASEIADWEKSSVSLPESRRYEAVKNLLWSWFKDMPDDLLAAFFTSFLERERTKDPAKPVAPAAWLASVGSILLGEYDNTKLPKADWVEIRECVGDVAGEIDLEALTYIMNLVLEYGALEEAKR